MIGIFVEGYDVTAQVDAEHRQSEAAKLREQFIAVLGHDLRNPLAAIDAGARILQRTPLTDKAQAVIRAVERARSR